MLRPSFRLAPAIGIALLCGLLLQFCGALRLAVFPIALLAPSISRPTPASAVPSLEDLDGDGVMNRLDNCVVVPNADQADADDDGLGDACECGDVSGDGRVDSTDARLIQRCVSGALSCEDLPGICDVNNDDACTRTDAQRIQQAVVGAIAWDQIVCNEKTVTLGVLGDSLADEYQGNAHLSTFDFAQIGLNWVEQLAKSRNIDFGAYSADPLVRGEPRNGGFAHNWSRYGVSVTEPTFSSIVPLSYVSLLEALPPFSEMVDGLAAGVAHGKVDIVYVQIGHNDFFVHLWCGGFTPPGPPDFVDRCDPDGEVAGGLFTGPEFDAFSGAVVAAIFAAVDTLRASREVPIVIGEIADMIPPLPLWHDPISVNVDADVYAAAVGSTNAALEQEASQRGIPFVKTFDAVRSRLEKPGFSFPAPWEECRDFFPIEENLCKIVIGERRVSASVADEADLIFAAEVEEHGPCWARGLAICASEAYALTAFLQDEVHPNTVLQGLTANGVIEALNTHFDLGVVPLSDAEILGHALGEYETPSEPE